MIFNRRIKQIILTRCSFAIFVAYIFLVAIPLGLWNSFISGRKPERQAAFHRHISRFFRLYIHHFVWGAKPEVRNPHQEEFHRPALIIANHQSLLDLAVTLMLHPHIVVMTGQWVWDSPLYGRVIRFADFFPSSLSLDAMVAHIRDCMSRGYSVLIFPEGTRSADCQIHKFRRGAFHIAEQLQCDVVPILLWGTGRMLPKNDFCLNPGRIIIEVGQRIRFHQGIMGTDHSSMTHYWHQWFVENYAQLDAEMV